MFICSAGCDWHSFLKVAAECKIEQTYATGMQALPNCSIAEEAQEAKAEDKEEQSQQAAPAKGLGGVFGGTQSVKAQPRKPEVPPSPRPAVVKLAER